MHSDPPWIGFRTHQINAKIEVVALNCLYRFRYRNQVDFDTSRDSDFTFTELFIFDLI